MFASALLPLFSEDEAEAIALAKPLIEAFATDFDEAFYQMMFKKLGLVAATEADRNLVDQLLKLLEHNKVDYTQFFQWLLLKEQPEDSPLQLEQFQLWQHQWQQAFSRHANTADGYALMAKNNPKIIPRNHWVENALETAVAGDMQSFNELFALLSNPYNQHPKHIVFLKIPLDFDEQYQTFCGT